jgi:hypothetical protein
MGDGLSHGGFLRGYINHLRLSFFIKVGKFSHFYSCVLLRIVDPILCIITPAKGKDIFRENSCRN